MKAAKKVKLIFEKGKQKKETYKEKGKEVTQSIEDSVVRQIERTQKKKIAKAKESKKDYEEIVVWEFSEIKETK